MARDFNALWQQARRGERSGLFAAENLYGMRYSGMHRDKGWTYSGWGQKASAIASSRTQLAKKSVETSRRIYETNRRMNPLIDSLAQFAARSKRGY
jgi:hypothetical protein